MLMVVLVLKGVSHVSRGKAEAERSKILEILYPAVRMLSGRKLKHGHVQKETSHHASQ